MATLTLTKVWVNLLSTGDAVSAYSAPGRQRSSAIDGEVVTYAGGRQRAKTRAGEKGSFGFVLREVSLTTITTLEGWKGKPVQVRDHRGQRFFGVFFAVTPTEHKQADLYDVALELRTVTVDEGV